MGIIDLLRHVFYDSIILLDGDKFRHIHVRSALVSTWK